MRARHGRRRPRLLHGQPSYVFNGAYPHRFVQQPALTWAEMRRLALVLAAGIPLGFLFGFGMVAFLIDTVRDLTLIGAVR